MLHVMALSELCLDFYGGTFLACDVNRPTDVHRRASVPTRADERAARLGVAVKPFVTTFGAVKILGYPCHVHYADTTTVQGLL